MYRKYLISIPDAVPFKNSHSNPPCFQVPIPPESRLALPDWVPGARLSPHTGGQHHLPPTTVQVYTLCQIQGPYQVCYAITSSLHHCQVQGVHHSIHAYIIVLEVTTSPSLTGPFPSPSLTGPFPSPSLTGSIPLAQSDWVHSPRPV